MSAAVALEGPACICGGPMVLRETPKFRHKDGTPKKFWACAKWQQTRCEGIIGAHPDGRPLGIPADNETKGARIRAHAMFDTIWKDAGSNQLSRKGAYAWMRKAMGLTKEQAHIGNFDKTQCEQLVDHVRRRLEDRQRENR